MKKWKGDIAFLLIIAALVGGWMQLVPRPGQSLLSPLDPPVDLGVEPLSYASPEGARLAYRLYEPAGEVKHVLVFLHDTLLHGGWYAELGRGLANEGVAVYLPDRRGWGYSSEEGPPPIPPEACPESERRVRGEGSSRTGSARTGRRKAAEDRAVLIADITAMIAVAQSRYPQREISLGGHGRGAGLAMEYVASRRPVAGVVLVAPYISDAQPNLDPKGWRQFVRAHPAEAFLAQSGLVDWTVWHVNWPRSMVEADPLIETICSISSMQETVPGDVQAAYSALSVPLLCVLGEDDPLFGAHDTPALVALFATPDKQIEIIPGVDYLGVISAAANPIARWLDEK